jgi:hypothetical protein
MFALSKVDADAAGVVRQTVRDKAAEVLPGGD